MIRAELGRSGRFETRATLLSAPGLADPTTAGDLLLATHLEIGSTLTQSILVAAEVDGTFEVQTVLEGVSVPFAWRDPRGGWRLLAHGTGPSPDGQAEAFMVVEARSEDGLRWGPFTPVQGLNAPRCESPVAGVFQGTWVLVCSERL